MASEPSNRETFASCHLNRLIKYKPRMIRTAAYIFFKNFEYTYLQHIGQGHYQEAYERAYERVGMEEKSKREAAMFIAAPDRERYMRQINHLNNERFRISNAHAEAEKTATFTNKWAANKIKNNRDRMGAFACLSMNDIVQTGHDLRRCVNELRFHVALLCDFQHAGPGDETYLFYDQPQYDEFWKAVTEANVHVYIHLAVPADAILEKLHAQRQNLIEPPLSFAKGVNLHTVCLILNGVFGRFPTPKVIICHLAEHIAFDFWRINHKFEDVKRPIAENEGRVIGHFSTATPKYVVNEIGADRALFSVDYPYETIENGCGWWDNDAKAIQEAVAGVDAYRRIGQDNAKKLLNLGSFHDSEARVS